MDYWTQSSVGRKKEPTPVHSKLKQTTENNYLFNIRWSQISGLCIRIACPQIK